MHLFRSPDRKPSRIYVDVTNACPLRCLHCCTESGSSSEDELSLVEVKDLIDQVHGMGVENLVLSGGEPMMRSDLFEMLAYARKKRLNVTLLTSGLLIDEPAARLLAELKIRVKISLDGVTARTHNFLRGSGTFERTLRASSLLQSARVQELCLHFTVHRKNCTELPRLPAFLASIGVRNLVIGVIKPSGRAKVNNSLLIPPSMVPFIQQKIEAVAQSGAITFQNFTDRGWKGFGCPATCNKFGITATGRITTCVFFGRELLGGNIREHGLATLWKEHIGRENVFVANNQCAQCANLPISRGGCRARALHYHGDVNATDPYCCALQGKKLFIEKQRPLLEAALRDRERGFS